jgi:hypothetical protein
MAKWTMQDLNAALLKYRDSMKGGKGDKKDPSKFSKSSLLFGINVEREHTTDIVKALEITVDHLSERKDYYKKLDAAGLVDEARRAPWNAFATSVRRTINTAAADQQKKEDAKYTGGYTLEVTHRVANVPKVTPRALAQAQQVVTGYHAMVRKMRAENPVGSVEYPESELKRTLADMPFSHVATRNDLVRPPGGGPEMAVLVHRDIEDVSDEAAEHVTKVRRSMKVAGYAHQILATDLGRYGARSVPDIEHAAGWPKDDPTYHSMPHVGPDLHRSTFHFTTRDAAWDAAMSLKLRQHPFTHIDAFGHNVEKKTRKKLFTVHPDKPATRHDDRPALEEATGAFRDKDGRFRNLHHKGHVNWVPHKPKAFTEYVESMGGKVKNSGNTMALLFRDEAASKRAHARLAEAGHRVTPHHLPGVFLVVHINEQAVHETFHEVFDDVVAAKGAAKRKVTAAKPACPKGFKKITDPTSR